MHFQNQNTIYPVRLQTTWTLHLNTGKELVKLSKRSRIYSLKPIFKKKTGILHIIISNLPLSLSNGYPNNPGETHHQQISNEFLFSGKINFTLNFNNM